MKCIKKIKQYRGGSIPLVGAEVTTIPFTNGFLSKMDYMINVLKERGNVE